MLSPERKKFPPSFMTHQDMSSRKTFVFNCAQSENVCVMFILFCCLVWCHIGNCKHDMLVGIIHKSQKEKISCVLSA